MMPTEMHTADHIGIALRAYMPTAISTNPGARQTVIAHSATM
jgi:hypothetical protein